MKITLLDETEMTNQKLNSDQSFGFMMAAVSCAVGGWYLYKLHPWGWVFLIISLVFIILSLTMPHLLAPLNRWWYQLGLLMHLIMTPIIMGLLFWIIFIPIGSLMRLVGARPLLLEYSPHQNSYWIKRNSAPPSKESFKNQF